MTSTLRLFSAKSELGVGFSVIKRTDEAQKRVSGSTYRFLRLFRQRDVYNVLAEWRQTLREGGQTITCPQISEQADTFVGMPLTHTFSGLLDLFCKTILQDD